MARYTFLFYAFVAAAHSIFFHLCSVNLSRVDKHVRKMLHKMMVSEMQNNREIAGGTNEKNKKK